MGILYYGTQPTPTTYGMFSITGPSGSPQLVASGVFGPAGSVFAGTTLYFNGDDSTHGFELWKTNGATSTMVADIYPGAGSSDPYDLTNVNGTIFFTANDGTHGIELWKSDGTTAGTTLVADIDPGPDSSTPEDLVADNGALYFFASNGTSNQLYTSNGQTSGTVPITTFAAGSDLEYLSDVNG